MKRNFVRVFAALMLVLSFSILTPGNSVRAAAITSTANGGNWSVNATWAGGVVPGPGDTVTIANGANVTIDTPASCSTLTFASVNASSLVTISGSNSLTVSGLIGMPRPATGFNCTLDVGAGTLSAGSLTMKLPRHHETTSSVFPAGTPRFQVP